MELKTLNGNVTEPLGPKLRRMRRRLGLTLDDLAGRTSISKPYLSLIETGRVPNPPSDEKLRRLELVLGFPPGELLCQAHLQRTPKDVRAVLGKLLRDGEARDGAEAERRGVEAAKAKGKGGTVASMSSHMASDGAAKGSMGRSVASSLLPNNLDAAYLSGVLQQLVERSAGNVEEVSTNAVPVINKVSAGYPKDFTDLSYPPRVADDYVGCPDLHDKDAFAARVHGDSMAGKYREGDIVIFSPSAAPRDGDDCFVRFEDGHTTFKRVFFETDEKGGSTLRLQPRNEKYRALTVDATKVTGVWKAVFKYQRVDEG